MDKKKIILTDKEDEFTYKYLLSDDQIRLLEELLAEDIVDSNRYFLTVNTEYYKEV